ncbi:MAG TPA: hypothetical protein VGH63_06030 [Polyangia bacterium]
MPGQRIEGLGWEVDSASEPGLLRLTVRGRVGAEEMRKFVVAHNNVIDGYAGADYKVLCDIRAMQPLAPESAELFGAAKVYSDAQSNFRGSAVWTSSAVVSLQHARTSKTSGVASTELISSDEQALRGHLANVWRG